MNKVVFRFAFSKSLEIRQFTLCPTFLSRPFPLFCPTFCFYLLWCYFDLSFSSISLLSLSLSFSISLLSFTMANSYPVYNIPKLSLSFFLPLSKSSPLIALNENQWTFSSLLKLKIHLETAVHNSDIFIFQEQYRKEVMNLCTKQIR